ncbi:hypothetical protein JCM21714_1640 [Gracilibacillus boraciitolerans JCM 21714]|uniref:Prepilin-type N-terminal cleavage/methylation domain-containing protein n=1 Tax=Gracilibacillus boraciitolerans JCM 21714 TaxID=1298598 RepID=W4VHF1_9BACI|nr:prepilin-type N-terminal cleavage/methylation domain-containing protein [Gracilibacillus boraciitolerans]GAE92632.1 hypothetical protein JCM21714_1640 [Gracilibacillus boraciitolerans JCM 21714]
MMIKNEKGLTLVELLGVLAILSIVIMLISSAHLFGQKQYVNQTDEINHKKDVQLLMSQVTKDVRTAAGEDVSVGEYLKIGPHQYNKDGTTIYRDSQIVSSKIAQFDYDITNDYIDIKILSKPDKQGEQHDLDTRLYFRK